MLNAVKAFRFLQREDNRPLPFIMKWRLGELTPDDLYYEGNLIITISPDLPPLPENLHVTGILLFQLPTARQQREFQRPYGRVRINYMRSTCIDYSGWPIMQLPRGLQVKELNVHLVHVITADHIPEDIRCETLSAYYTPLEDTLNHMNPVEFKSRWPGIQRVLHSRDLLSAVSMETGVQELYYVLDEHQNG